MTSKRLEILENSLAKKESELSRKISEHFYDVKSARKLSNIAVLCVMMTH